MDTTPLLGKDKDLQFGIYIQMTFIERLAFFKRYLDEHIHLKTSTSLSSDIGKLEQNALKVIKKLEEMMEVVE
jgi:hypothetical protein